MRPTDERATSEDPTKHAEAPPVEDELMRANAFLDTVIDMAPIAMWVSDAEGTIIRVNRALCRIMAVTPEMIVGKYNVLADQNLVVAGVMPRVQAVYERLQPAKFNIPWSGAASGMREFEAISELHIDVSMFPILDGERRLKSVVCQWADVTDLVKTQAALRVSERKFRQTLTDLDGGYFRLSSEGVLLDHNRAFSRTLGYPADQDVRGLPAPDLWSDSGERVRRAALAGERSGVSRLVIDARSALGEELALQVSAHVVHGEDGTVAIEGVFSDITELRRAGEEIRRMNQELEQRVAQRTARLEAVNTELEAFVHSVSHDLRAPLRAIAGYTNMLLEEHATGLDAEAVRLLDCISSNAERMSQLIAGLSSLSQMTLDQREGVLLDMTALAAEAFREVAPVDGARSVGFVLSPLAPARGDPALIRQVWINLLGNAVKFSGSRAEQVVEVGSYVHQGMNVYFVRDNGVGFDPARAHELFGVFRRLHNTGDFEGTGLGLAIVQRIVHLHHGIVWAKGQVDEGAAFHFALPALGGDA